MKNLINALLNSGIGTIEGYYRMTPKTDEYIGSYVYENTEEEPNIYPNFEGLVKIPDWMEFVICDKNNNCLGIINKEIQEFDVLGCKLYAKNFDVSFSMNEMAPHFAIIFSDNSAEDDGVWLTIYFIYNGMKRDGNGLEFHINENYSFVFRATIGPTLFLKNIQRIKSMNQA